MRKSIFFLIIMLALTSCNLNQEDSVETEQVNEEMDSELEVQPEQEPTHDESVKEDHVEEEEIFQMRQAIGETGFLKTQGKNIYDDYGQGNLVQLKGVNAGGYLFQEFWMTPTKPSANVHAELDIYQYLTETYGEERMRELVGIYQDNYWSEDDFDKLATHGANVIRLPFWYLNVVNQKGELLEDWYERFDWFIEEAGQRGMYVILDFHGAPGSQNGSDHSGVDGGENKEEASNFFFGDEDTVSTNQDLFYSIWETIAKRYKGNPVVAGYDLLNEPYCTYRYSSSYAVDSLHQELWAVYDEAYRRIRAIDPDHIILMEATWDPIDLPNPDDYGWENVVYEYHNYLYDDYDNENGGQIHNMQNKINLIHAAAYDVPSLMGEFSYFNSYEAWDEGLKLLTEEGLHWTMWTYKVTSNYGNWGLYHHTGGDISIEAVDDEKLALIWAKVGDSRANEPLIEVIETYLQQEFIEDK